VKRIKNKLFLANCAFWIFDLIFPQELHGSTIGDAIAGIVCNKWINSGFIFAKGNAVPNEGFFVFLFHGYKVGWI